MKIKKKLHIAENYLAHGRVGTALKGLLKDQITDCFCPQELMDALDALVLENYERGFEDALTYMRNEIMFIEVEE